MEEKDLKKGQYIVEPGIAISEFVEKINKLSYKKFPVAEVLKLFQKSPLSLEYFEPYIFFSDARYTRNLIHKAPDFELILMCWKSNQYSAIHGHEGQKCWFRVEDGALEVTDYQEEPNSSSSILKKLGSNVDKAGFVGGPALIHKVANNTNKNAISLHLYALPFDQCDIYDLELDQKTKVKLGYHSIRGKLVAPEEKR